MVAVSHSGNTGAAALLNGLPNAIWLFAGRGHDTEWFIEGLKNKGITPCILGRKPLR